MPKLTKTSHAIARNERIEQLIREINEVLGFEHGNALGVFAHKYGNDWATELLDQWYNGRDANFQDPATGEKLGHFLRQIRNHPKFGPAFYRAYHGE
jgi:hypothetical protein